jgi:vacuolar-type H+-ATPase subunit I/STV1
VWGNFDPSVLEKLQKHGVTLRFFELTEKKFESLQKETFCCNIINRRSGNVYFVVIERGERVSVDADESTLPNLSLRNVQEQIIALESERKEIEQQQKNLVRYLNVLHKTIAGITDIKNFEAARLNMLQTTQGKVLLLNGWFPAAKTDAVQAFLGKFSAWYEIANPVAGENVPIQIKNWFLPSLFEPITKIFSLPNYFEFDPTPFFAPFFALFVGLCVGDVGYGLLLLIAGLVAVFVAPKPYLKIAWLVVVLGASVMCCGFLLNGFFGSTLFGGLCVLFLFNNLGQKPEAFGNGVVLSAVPGTQGLYGFVGFFLYSSVVTPDFTLFQGTVVFAAGLMIGLACFISAIYQGKVCAHGINAIASGYNAFGNTMMLAAYPEFYAILSLIGAILLKGLIAK